MHMPPHGIGGGRTMPFERNDVCVAGGADAGVVNIVKIVGLVEVCGDNELK